MEQSLVRVQNQQTDEQIEVLNKYLQQHICSFFQENPPPGECFRWAEYHYNTAVHNITDFSPFHEVYGKPPSSISYIPGTSNNEAIDTTQTRRDDILKLLHTNLLKAQKQVKTQAET